MKRYLSLILFISFWGCEEEQGPEDCAGVAGGDNICGCTDSTATNYDSTATYDDGSCINTIEIIYNIHDSLPADWITEFYVIMNNLQNFIPSYQNYFNSLTVYAWNDNIDDPYPGSKVVPMLEEEMVYPSWYWKYQILNLHMIIFIVIQ